MRLGFELRTAAHRRGASIAAAAGLTNLRFSLIEADLADLGEAELIACPIRCGRPVHGVWWFGVGDPVREGILLAAAADELSSGGVVINWLQHNAWRGRRARTVADDTAGDAGGGQRRERRGGWSSRLVDD